MDELWFCLGFSCESCGDEELAEEGPGWDVATACTELVQGAVCDVGEELGLDAAGTLEQGVVSGAHGTHGCALFYLRELQTRMLCHYASLVWA